MKHVIFILLLATLTTAGATEIDHLESIKAESLTGTSVVSFDNKMGRKVFDGKLARKVYKKLKNTPVIEDKISGTEVKEVGSLSCSKKGRKYQCTFSYSLVPEDANLNNLQSKKIFEALDTKFKKRVWHGGKRKALRGYTSSDFDQFVCDQIPLEVKSDTANTFSLYQCSVLTPQDRGRRSGISISFSGSLAF